MPKINMNCINTVDVSYPHGVSFSLLIVGDNCKFRHILASFRAWALLTCDAICKTFPHQFYSLGDHFSQHSMLVNAGYGSVTLIGIPNERNAWNITVCN